MKYLLLLLVIVSCASAQVYTAPNPADTGTFEPVDNTGRFR